MNPLRQFIREELARLDEMPYAGTKPTVFGDDERSQGYYNFETEPNTKAIDRYMQSQTWATKAKQAYANFPYGVWVIPFAGAESDQKLSSVGGKHQRSYFTTVPMLNNLQRSMLVGGKQRDVLLNDMGVNARGIAKGDLVIIPVASVAQKGVLPTPWMVFHAVFDDLDTTSRLFGGTVLSDLVEELTGAWNDPEIPIDLSKGDVVSRVLTMRSARDGKMNSGASDIVAEMMCQMLLTRDGLRFNTDDLTHEEIEYLETVKQRLGHVAREVIRECAGKALIVSVA